MIAVGYARRSKESGERTVSLEDQRERITAYCRERGWELVDVLVDDGISGGRRERLHRLADRVRGTGARVVVVYHLDRFARDVAALLDSVRAFARRGVELHVVGRGRIETDTATGFLMTGVEGLMAEHFRRLIAEKMAARRIKVASRLKASLKGSGRAWLLWRFSQRVGGALGRGFAPEARPGPAQRTSRHHTAAAVAPNAIRGRPIALHSCGEMAMATAKRPLTPRTPRGGPATLQALPMELRPGDRFTDESGTWEVIGRPSSQRGGKEVKVEVQRPGQPETLRERRWPAYRRVTATRNSQAATGRG